MTPKALSNTAVATIFVLLATSQASAQGETGFASNGVTAHRGASGHYVENTMTAFREALKLGVDWIECDVFLTRDNKLVVTHDRSTDRLTGVQGIIGEMTYAELEALDTSIDFKRRRKLDRSNWPVETMPLLSEVLLLIKSQTTTRLSIQPKDNGTAAAIELIAEFDAAGWVGFNDSNLQKMALVKQLNPKIKVFWDRLNLETIDGDIATATELGFETLVFNRSDISTDAIDKVQQAGLEFGVWTVNDPQEMAQFIAMGVDRLYTDNPATALALFAASNR